MFAASDIVTQKKAWRATRSCALKMTLCRGCMCFRRPAPNSNNLSFTTSSYVPWHCLGLMWYSSPSSSSLSPGKIMNLFTAAQILRSGSHFLLYSKQLQSVNGKWHQLKYARYDYKRVHHMKDCAREKIRTHRSVKCMNAKKREKYVNSTVSYICFKRLNTTTLQSQTFVTTNT